MTWRDWTSGVGVRTALGTLLVAAGTLVWTVVAALRTDGVTARPEATSIAQDALDAPPPLPHVDVAAAVATDLFASDRTPPPVRYRPPDEAATTSGSSARQPPPEPVVLGTAIAVDGSSFATCQLGSSRLLMVRVGDHVGTYVVKSIERGRVVFGTPAGKQLVILAPQPGS